MTSGHSRAGAAVLPRLHADELGGAEVIIEKTLGPDGAQKEVSMERWSFKKVNNQWLIIGRF